MTKTQNYNLNQWDPTDPIRREDFNADNAAIDAALASGARIVTGSYVGTGTYGESNPQTLTCPFKPRFLMIRDGRGSDFLNLTAIKGQPEVTVYASHTSLDLRGTVYLTWGENNVTWYGTKEDCYYNLNGGGQVYYYLIAG